MDPQKRIIVIGAGPAGLSAALSALEEGASVTVLEHMEEAGRKLLITGNGACNFSNTDVSPEHYHGDPDIIRSVLEFCSWTDLKELFYRIGIESEERHYRFENYGYLYPSSGKAATVRDAFVREILKLGGRILCSCAVSGISRENALTFTVHTSLGSFSCERVIFATGSNAAPFTGSDSSIYPVLKGLGIREKQWLPALCALKSKDPVLKEMSGLRCDGTAMLADETDGEQHGSAFGEIQFRDHYISGIPVMQLSRYFSIGLRQHHRMYLLLALQKANNKNGFLPYTDLKLEITGTDGFDRCVCCSGGIEGNQIDPDSLEYRMIPGIYFAGELLDVDGDCGGFNLHFAFASGRLAGKKASL